MANIFNRVARSPATYDLSGIEHKPIFRSAAARYLHLRSSDLTQEGSARLQRSKEEGVILPTRYVSYFSYRDYLTFGPDYQEQAYDPKGGSEENHLAACKVVRDAITTVGIYCYMRPSAPMHADLIAGLQAAMLPKSSVTTEAIAADKEFIAFKAELIGSKRVTFARAASEINQLFADDEFVRNWTSAYIRDTETSDTSSIIGADGSTSATLDYEAIDTIALEDITALYFYVLHHIPDRGRYIMKSFLTIYASSMNDDAGLYREACDCPSTASLMNGIMSRLRGHNVVIPGAVMAAIRDAECFTNAFVTVAFLCQPIEGIMPDAEDLSCNGLKHPHGLVRAVNLGHQEIDRIAGDGDNKIQSMLATIAYSCMAAKTFTGPRATDRARAAGGVGMAGVLASGTYIDSTEVFRMANFGDPLPCYFDLVTSDVLGHVVGLLRDPEALAVVAAGRVISYLKAGHNATAAGLIHTVTSMARAVGVTRFDASMVLEQEGPMLGYYGCHGGSVRLTFAIFIAANAHEALSFAIMRRFFVDGPGVVGYALCNKYFQALWRAGFWRVLNQTAMVDDWNAAFSAWYPGSHLECPYSQYLYGASRAPDAAFRARVENILAYAAHVDTVMPASSMATAPSLKKMARSAADNDVASLYHSLGFASQMQRMVGNNVKAAMIPKRITEE